jgi:hypothetical protein
MCESGRSETERHERGLKRRSKECGWSRSGRARRARCGGKKRTCGDAETGGSCEYEPRRVLRCPSRNAAAAERDTRERGASGSRAAAPAGRLPCCSAAPAALYLHAARSRRRRSAAAARLRHAERTAPPRAREAAVRGRSDAPCAAPRGCSARWQAQHPERQRLAAQSSECAVQARQHACPAPSGALMRAAAAGGTRAAIRKQHRSARRLPPPPALAPPHRISARQMAGQARSQRHAARAHEEAPAARRRCVQRSASFKKARAHRGPPLRCLAGSASRISRQKEPARSKQLSGDRQQEIEPASARRCGVDAVVSAR